nr:hypothetical protein [uncultured Novosphingobium sp.]
MSIKTETGFFAEAFDAFGLGGTGFLGLRISLLLFFWPFAIYRSFEIDECPTRGLVSAAARSAVQLQDAAAPSLT